MKISADYPGVFTKLDREWARKVYSVQGAGTAAAPVVLVKNTRLTRSSSLGLISGVGNTNAGNPLRDMVFRTNGVLDKFQHGTPIPGTTAAESGGDGAYFYNASLQNLFQSDLAYGRFDYDLTDSVHFYAQATGMLSHVKNNHESVETTAVTLSATNAFLSPQYQTAMTAAGRPTFLLSKMLTQINAKQPETYTRGYMANFGLEGTIGEWKWDVSWVNSANQQRTRNNYNPMNGRAAAAVDAVRAPNGDIVCNVTLTNPGLYPGCVPLNMFGPTSESAEAMDYVLDVTTYVAKTSLDNIGASFSGSPFSTWAGPVQTAISGEWRKLNYSLVSDAQATAADCTGLRYNCNNTTFLYLATVLSDRTPVSQSVKEAAVEADVPLLKDVPFAESFNVNGAFRLTDYSNSGRVETWKVGVNWVVNDQITFRGTRSRDIRAPNLNELYAPRRVTPSGCTDRLINLTAQCPVITDANANLQPEVAQTWTAGVVLRPAFPAFADWGIDLATLRGLRHAT